MIDLLLLLKNFQLIMSFCAEFSVDPHNTFVVVPHKVELLLPWNIETLLHTCEVGAVLSHFPDINKCMKVKRGD